MTFAIDKKTQAEFVKPSTLVLGAAALLAATLAFLLSGCPQETEEARPAPDAAEQPREKAVDEPDSAPAEPEADAFEDFEAIITAAAAGVRRSPTMDRHVDLGEGRVFNWLLTLYRGDQVTVSKAEEHGDEEWVWVRAVGDQEGWVKAEWLMRASEGGPAAAAEELRVFELPDPTRPQRGQTIAAGTYMIVLGTEGDFSRVNHVAQRSAWVRTRELTTAEDEIGVSRVISRIRWMKSRNDAEGIEDLVEGAREAFPGAALLTVLAAELEPAAE